MEQPWFLTVALVNPHDVMWFPIDQPGYAEERPDLVRDAREILELAKWKDDDVLPVFDQQYDEICETLPSNFADDLIDKPEPNGSGAGTSSTDCGATSTRPTRRRGCATSTTT